jgi:hypothetical protein
LQWDATQTELDSTAATIEQLDAEAKRDLESLDTEPHRPTNSSQREVP